MKYLVGQRVSGTVNNVTDLGVFLSLPRGHGLIYYKDFGSNWQRRRHDFTKGQRLRVVVVHNHRGKISLSLNRVNDPVLIDPCNPFSKVKAHEFENVLQRLSNNAEREIKELSKQV